MNHLTRLAILFITPTPNKSYRVVTQAISDRIIGISSADPSPFILIKVRNLIMPYRPQKIPFQNVYIQQCTLCSACTAPSITTIYLQYNSPTNTGGTIIPDVRYTSTISSTRDTRHFLRQKHSRYRGISTTNTGQFTNYLRTSTPKLVGTCSETNGKIGHATAVPRVSA